MITKQDKLKILERYENKEEKIFISSILDKSYRFEKENKLQHTNFLNLNELNIVKKLLNELKIPFVTFSQNEILNKKVIFFIPDYISDIKSVFDDYITVLKVIPNVKEKLLHKDYMGRIYSLGIKNEMIGDIFAYDEFAYIYCMKSVSDYFFSNLFKAGNQEVKVEILNLDNEELNNISINLKRQECIIPSNRVDVLLSSAYGIGRSNSKEKIVKGDLYINDKNIINPSQIVKEGDIISFRKCGKLKVGENIRNTKSGNIVIEIYKYI